MKINYLSRLLVIIIMICTMSKSTIAQDLVAQGKNTFTTHCSFCHHIGSVLVGPDLSNVDKRHTKEWIVNFVSSSQTMVKRGDKEALEIFDKFKVVMPDQADLSSADINNIISYISTQSIVSVEKPPLATPYFAKESYLPINKNNYLLITFYLLLVSILIMSLFFAVSVQAIKRNSTIKT